MTLSGAMRIACLLCPGEAEEIEYYPACQAEEELESANRIPQL